jgi:hypothetical protein
MQYHQLEYILRVYSSYRMWASFRSIECSTILIFSFRRFRTSRSSSTLDANIGLLELAAIRGDAPFYPEYS